MVRFNTNEYTKIKATLAKKEIKIFLNTNFSFLFSLNIWTTSPFKIKNKGMPKNKYFPIDLIVSEVSSRYTIDDQTTIIYTI